MSDHIATYGSIGWSGRRCGTVYVYSPREAWNSQGEPWFRFRNRECEQTAREAWYAPAPMSGKYFDLADESEYPNIGHSTRIDGEILSCPLAKYEREGETRGWGRHLQRIGGTEYCRWYRKRPDYCWYPFGRLLKLNAAGLAVLADAQQ